MSRLGAREIEDEAARWLARMEGDGWTPEQEAELETWLQADPRHDGAFLQAQAAWAMLGRAAAPAEEAAESTGMGRVGRRAWMAGAGGALAASIAGGLVFWARGTRYRTETGEIRRVPLSDGSTAAINTESLVEVEIGRTLRQVRIEKGEAWFQVAKDPKRPFLVEAGRIRVQALGTAFSVRRRDAGADVLVTEGVVQAWSDGAEGQMIRIAAGSSAFIADNAAISRAPAQANGVDRALAWRNGRIDLAGQTLGEAAAEFNRYNMRKIVIADPRLGGEQFDGIFRTDDPMSFAEMVKSSLDVPVDISDPAEIRIGRASG